MKNQVIIIMICLSCLITSCYPNDIDRDLTQETEDMIVKILDYDKELEKFIEDEEITGISAIVFNGNDVLYEGYIGMADIEKNKVLDDNYVFLIASISKTITATALMQLYERGMFELDDPINDYLDFDIQNPYDETPITFEMLLTHTSSIADGSSLDNQYYYMKDSPVDLRDFMKEYFSQNGKYYNEAENFHDFVPGSAFEYSNVGSALMGVLVENISLMGFNEYCKINIFQPLEMNHTYWRLDEIDIDRIVVPYDFDGKPLPHFTFTDYPNGGLRTNVVDLMKFMVMYSNNGLYNEVQVLENTTIELMLSSVIPDIDAEVGLHFYNDIDQSNLWWHNGGESGVSTVMGFNIETNVGVVILCNREDVVLEPLMHELYEYGLSIGK